MKNTRASRALRQALNPSQYIGSALLHRQNLRKIFWVPLDQKPGSATEYRTDERDITQTETQLPLPLTLGYQILISTPRTASWSQFYHAYNTMIQCYEFMFQNLKIPINMYDLSIDLLCLWELSGRNTLSLHYPWWWIRFDSNKKVLLRDHKRFTAHGVAALALRSGGGGDADTLILSGYSLPQAGPLTTWAGPVTGLPPLLPG